MRRFHRLRGLRRHQALRFDFPKHRQQLEYGVVAGTAGRLRYHDSDRIYFRYNIDHGFKPPVPIRSTRRSTPTAFSLRMAAKPARPRHWSDHGEPVTALGLLLHGDLRAPDLPGCAQDLPDYLGLWRWVPTTRRQWQLMGGSDNIYPQGRKVRQWQLIDDFSKIWGRIRLN